MASNGEVDFKQISNDARGSKGTVGLGLPTMNDYRGAGGGSSGDKVNNDYRCDMPETATVEPIQKARPV